MPEKTKNLVRNLTGWIPTLDGGNRLKKPGSRSPGTETDANGDPQEDSTVLSLSPEAEALGHIAARIQCALAGQRRRFDQDDDETEVDTEALVDRLVKEYRGSLAWADDLESRVRSWKSQTEILQNEKKQREYEKRQWEDEKAAALSTLARIRKQRDAEEQLRMEKEDAIRRIMQDHEHALNQERTRHTQKIRTLSSQHSREVEDLKSQLESAHDEQNSREEEHLMEKTRLRNAHSAQIAQLEQDHREQLSAQEEAYKTHRDSLEAQFVSSTTALKRTHAQQQARLQSALQSKMKALVARENFTPISDGELKAKYATLLRQVDALARLEWTRNQSPWTDEKQIKISDTPKRLRKQILQESIWNILFERIFCSPFRIFGHLGSTLEQDWNKAFGKGESTGNELYAWPEPYPDSERWRYETLRQCEEALRIETSEVDPRTKWRVAFRASLGEVDIALEEVLRMVTVVDDKMRRAISELSENAARVWLVFGTQRCRLLVVVNGLNTTEETKEGTSGAAQSVELLVQPELRRIGDGDGLHLDREQVVSGCEGYIKRILYDDQ